MSSYIELETDEALVRKWGRGREQYGEKFVGHPLRELDEELLDGMNYVTEATRQGWPMGNALATLRCLRESVRRLHLAVPEAPCPPE